MKINDQQATEILAFHTLTPNLLLCSHSLNDAPPPPEPQRNVSMAAEQGAVRPPNPDLKYKSDGIYKYRRYPRQNKILDGRTAPRTAAMDTFH